jgi:translation initiation factor IF-3
MLEKLQDVCKVEKPPMMEGKQMTALLAPKPGLKPKKPAPPPPEKEKKPKPEKPAAPPADAAAAPAPAGP